MIKRCFVSGVLAAILLLGNNPPLKGANEVIPSSIPGVELATQKGWLANIYPWGYDPVESTVHPVRSLWDPPKWDSLQKRYIAQYQSPAQIIEQSRQLERYGSSVDVLELNVCPSNFDYNHWLATYLGKNSSRPFFVLYEHVFGNCNYAEQNGPKNMDLAANRKAFIEDIDFIFRNIILPNDRRYITVKGRAVIFLWSVVQMEGDFASLLEEVKSKYPVFFIGSVNIMGFPSHPDFINTLRSLDGYMEYATIAGNYQSMIKGYKDGLKKLQERIIEFEKETKRHYLVFPTFQFAFDDTRFPGRTNIPMYPMFKEEVDNYATWMRDAKIKIDPDLGRPLFDNVPTFGVYSELPEGGAIIESQCALAQYQRYRWTGCGTGRLEIMKKYFGK